MFEGGLGRFVGDRYHIIRELGRGGMGVVYLGRDLRRDMDVAIKFRGITHHDATLWLKREFRAVVPLHQVATEQSIQRAVVKPAIFFQRVLPPGAFPYKPEPFQHPYRAEVVRNRVGIDPV